MILTVTLNPAIDRTIWVERLSPGELHRVGASQSDAAGKGVNVSKALKGWGAETEVVATVAGETGRLIERALSAEGLAGTYIAVEGESRINIKVVEEPTGRLTELNEVGPYLDAADLERVAKAVVARLDGASWLVLSGSLPQGAPIDAYRRLIEAAQKKRPGLPVALDSSGMALQEGIGATPSLVKPNRDEMEELLGRPLGGPVEWTAAVDEVRALGVERVVLSLGSEGALFGGDEGYFWAKSKPVEVASPTGCGDTLLAATLFALTQGWPWERCARFAVAAATAAAMLPGTRFPSLREIDQAVLEVTTKRL